MTRQKTTAHIRAVVGILKNNGRILVSQRPPEKIYAGFWEFPGGKIEHNELPIDALSRELKEELAIDVVHSTPWFSHTHIYPDKTVDLSIWLVREYLGEAQSNEGQVIKWVTWQELRSLNLLEGNLPILDHLKSLYVI